MRIRGEPTYAEIYANATQTEKNRMDAEAAEAIQYRIDNGHPPPEGWKSGQSSKPDTKDFATFIDKSAEKFE